MKHSFSGTVLACFLNQNAEEEEILDLSYYGECSLMLSKSWKGEDAPMIKPGIW